jgi:hypothetical protein
MGDGFSEPVAWHERDAVSDRRTGPGGVGLPSGQDDLAGRKRSRADERPPDALLASTAKSHESYDFALVNIEAHRANVARDGVAEGQCRRWRRPIRTHEDLLWWAADDGVDEPVGIGITGGAHVYQLPITKHRKPVRNREDLVQAMGYVDHADATRFERT